MTPVESKGVRPYEAHSAGRGETQDIEFQTLLSPVSLAILSAHAAPG